MTLLLLLVVLEIISYVVVRYTRAAWTFFYLPQAADFDQYAKSRHPILGWVSSPRESRPGAGKAVPGTSPSGLKALASLYGDSFTLSPGVDEGHTYAAVLSQLLNAGVINYGAPAYGTDQACLRFTHNTDDQAGIAVLGHMSENIRRNLNQFMDLIYCDPTGSGAVFFSPQFELASDGSVRFVPPPNLSRHDYIDCVKRPRARYLTHETFLPGSPFGRAEFRFPFTISIVRALATPSLRRPLETTELPWAEFYRPDHPAKGLQITVGIIRAFFEDAERRGKRPVLVIFPSKEDLESYAEHRKWSYQPLVDELRSRKIPHLDMGPFTLDALAGQAIDSIFQPDEHPNEKGCRIQAMGVYRHLRERGLVPQSRGELGSSATR